MNKSMRISTPKIYAELEYYPPKQNPNVQRTWSIPVTQDIQLLLVDSDHIIKIYGIRELERIFETLISNLFQFPHFTDEETDVYGPQATVPKPHITLVTNDSSHLIYSV